ncbi:TonB-dependent receptor plug domain-containing protein [Gluconacetobacter sp. Hr-1-5]|uniref:TonB-dependent receptor plug domain-containing protein n=1 Tax=Gluconacetobacter sp. Hr-1-5 TaxID=3395370 RepID=UPI003B52B4AB
MTFRKMLLAACATPVLLAAQNPAFAQTAAPTKEKDTHVRHVQAVPPAPHAVTAPSAMRQREPAEAVIVTGTRQRNATARQSLAPVDVVTGAALRGTGQSDLRMALSLLNPSVTTQSYDSDAAALTNTLRLRGLNPDQVLVLVNGKRRHVSANIVADRGPEQGSVAVDLDMIPMSMVDHIEILRDGAAAQYGADAVAGVVNIILKSGANKGTVQGMTGAYDHGDGWNASVMGDYGFKWGNDGYLHLGFDFKHQDATNRSGVDSRTGRADFETFGLPEQTRENFGMNWEKPLTGTVTFFGNATYAHRFGRGYQYYRVPTILPSYYPYGFSPALTNNENDYSVLLGLKGVVGGFDWQVSTTYGADRISMGMINSANLDLYADTGATPTTFHISGYNQALWANNVDFVRRFKVPVIDMPLNLAFGAEHRMENYTIYPGEAASYYKSGTSSLPGISPASSGDFYRDVYAGYVDVSMKPTKKLNIDFAGRYEHYSDTQDTETGKVAARYDFNRRWALRASISNGFRAPSLAEEHYSNVAVSPTAATGQIAPSSVAAEMLGANALKPERSTSVSGGIVAEPVDRFHVAVDVYQVDIRDRIVDGNNYQGASTLAALKESGLQISDSINPAYVSAQYFTNGASTRTQGLDLTADYMVPLRQYGRLNLNLAIDLNRSTVRHIGTDHLGNPLLNAQGVSFLTRESPRSKIIMGGNWTIKRWTINLREIRWGQTSGDLTYYAGPYYQSNTQFLQFISKPKWQTDLEVSYRALDRLNISVGAVNLFNKKATMLPFNGRYLGAQLYDIRSAQIGFQGGYYYLRVDYSL